MPEPLFTPDFHGQFLDAVKKHTFEKRVDALTSLVASLPEDNQSLIRIVMKHLTRVAAHSNKNLMAASNLGVVFGPTLMKSKEEFMAAIMNLKYQSIVIELLINEFDKIFGPDTPDILDSPDGKQDKEIPTDSAPVNTNPFLDDEADDSSSWVVVKPKPLPKKRNSEGSSGTTLIESKTPPKPLLRPKAYCAPPPPSNKPTPAAQPRIKTVPTSESEENLNRLSDSSSMTSTPQSEGKTPLSPRDFWREKDGAKPTPPPKRPDVVAEFRNRQVANCSRPISMTDDSMNDKGSAHAIHRVSSQGGSLNRGLQSWGTRPPPLPREPPPQEEPTPSPQTKTPKKVKTIFPCVAENSSELSFDAGIVICNVRPSKEPGWLEGTLNGRTGLIPENYVEPMT